jgi:hypothetical protein
VAASVLNRRDPSRVEGVLRDLKLAHGQLTKCRLGGVFGLVGPDVCQQPLLTSLSLGLGLVPELLLAAPLTSGRFLGLGRRATLPGNFAQLESLAP